jgi:hypothetical protein
MSKTRLIRLNYNKATQQMQQAENGLFCSYYNVKIILEEMRKEFERKKKK